MTTFSLEALVQRARTGDHDAWGALYAQFDGPIRRHLLRRVGDPEIAADLAQTMWEKAWRKLPATRPDTGADFPAWLYRIAKNTAMDAHTHDTVLQWVPWETYTAIPHPTQIAPDAPEDVVLRDELRAEVRAVLAKLPPRHRQMLQVYAICGANYGAHEETGAILGMSRSQIKQLIFRARQMYRRVVAGTYRSCGSQPALPIDPASLRRLRRVPIRRDAGSIYRHRDGRPKPYRASCGRKFTVGQFATYEEAVEALASFHAQQESAAS